MGEAPEAVSRHRLGHWPLMGLPRHARGGDHPGGPGGRPVAVVLHPNDLGVAEDAAEG